jgi:hypothetical protein
MRGEVWDTTNLPISGAQVGRTLVAHGSSLLSNVALIATLALAARSSRVKSCLL